MDEYLQANEGCAPEGELVRLLLHKMREAQHELGERLQSTGYMDLYESTATSNRNGKSNGVAHPRSSRGASESLSSRVVARHTLNNGYEMAALLEEYDRRSLSSIWGSYVRVMFVTNTPEFCAVRYAISDAPHSDTWLLELQSADSRLRYSDVFATEATQSASVLVRRTHVGLRASIVAGNDAHSVGAFSLPLQNALAMSSIARDGNSMPACEDTVASSLLDQAIAQREGTALFQKVFPLGSSKRLFVQVMTSREVRCLKAFWFHCARFKTSRSEIFTKISCL